MGAHRQREWAGIGAGLAGLAGLAAAAVIGLAQMPLPAAQAEEPAACPGNLLQNPGFENGFSARKVAGEVVGNGWTAWYQFLPGLRGVNYVPDYSPRRRDRDGPWVVHEGLWSQEMATSGATHTAGLWQRVYIPAPSQIQVSVWAHAWASDGDDPLRSEPPGTYMLLLGVDPKGGEDPDQERIRWTRPVTVTDVWLPLSMQLEVEGPAVTVFLRGQPLARLKHNVSHWDSACLRVIGRAGEPPFTATPRPWPTRTPTPGTPTATPNRATRQAETQRRQLILMATATARAAAGIWTEPTSPALATRLAGEPLPPPMPVVEEEAEPGEEGKAAVEAVAAHSGLILLLVAMFAAGLAIGLGRDE